MYVAQINGSAGQEIGRVMLDLILTDELHLENTGLLAGHYRHACGASETVLPDKNWQGLADSESLVLSYLRTVGFSSAPDLVPVVEHVKP